MNLKALEKSGLHRAWIPSYAKRMANVRSSEIRELLKIIEKPGVISFAGGIPDPELFPVEKIQNAYVSILTDSTEAKRSLQYSVSEGDLDLRLWIVEHMKSKGVDCSVDNILITNGSQQALEFLGKAFISPGDEVFVTAPTYLGVLQAFSFCEPNYSELKITSNGVFSEQSGNNVQSPKRSACAYVVPDFANPTGETLNKDIREGILNLAEDKGIPVIEDSPYETLRFEGKAQKSLLAIDVKRTGCIDKSRVIYCGSFSKIFTPGLRIGWVCAAREVVNRLTLLKQGSDLNTPAINQRVILRLAQTAYDSQVERACQLYCEKRNRMLSLIEDVLPAGCNWTKPEGGMFIWVELPKGFDTAKILPIAVEKYGVAYVPGQAFFANRGEKNTLRLSYTLPSMEEISDGMLKLGRCIAEV